MQGLVRAAVLALLGFSVSGCATTMTVSSHVEPTADFARYRSYDWGPADALPFSDPRLVRNPSFQDYLMGAIARQLALRGIEQSATGTPDLLVHYHTNVTSRFTVNGVDRERGSCGRDGCPGEVVQYEAGTLVLDIVDARTNTLIWRGWAQDTFDGAIGDPDRMERKIDEAIPRMLARFPTGRLGVRP